MNPNDLSALREIILQSCAAHNETRRQAEALLAAQESQPGFSMMLLTLIDRLTVPSSPEDVTIRQTASVMFKNLVKRKWVPQDDETPLSTNDQGTIKSVVIQMMTTCAPDVQRQLSEAVSIIAKHDFPRQWNNLLPELVGKLSVDNLVVLKGVLLTINSILKRFRYVEKSDDLYEILVYCLTALQEPMTQKFEQLSAAVDSCPDNKEQLTHLLECLRLIARIFYSLNWQDIPEYFEDNLDRWAAVFVKFLSYNNPCVIDEDEEDEPGPIDNFQAAILDNLNIYAAKYEDVFQRYLGTFTQLVWKRLIEIGPSPKFDIAATGAIKFLNAVCSKDINRGLFTDAVLKDIVEHIVIKNLTVTEADEELFTDNPADYIRKDMEGSDQDTRRRCAMDLVRSLLKFFPHQISQLSIQYIGSLLEVYRTTRDWKAKDAALHLILAVSVKTGTIATGASELNPEINILELFQTQILPELQDSSVGNVAPIIKTDVLKLICVFRSQFDANFLMQLFAPVLQFLSSRDVVIQTYAAITIEKFLSVKDKQANGTQTSRISKDALAPHFQTLFSGLFAALVNPAMGENEYVMKCIMRTLSIAGSDVTPVTQLIVSHLTSALERACKNPVNPHYNHYLFESIALLVRASCGTGVGEITEANLACCAQFEALLFPPMQAVLAQDITEFVPYVFQILAQLLNARRPNSGLSDAYRALYMPLLSPTVWERKGNIPALVDLFKAYISKGMSEIIGNNTLTGVLGIFQKLLAAKSTEAHSFSLLNAIFIYCPQATLVQYSSTVFDLTLRRLTKAVEYDRVVPYCKYFIHSQCLFATIFGAPALYQILEGLRPGLTSSLISDIWLTNKRPLSSLSAVDAKHVLIGASKLLVESPLLDTHPASWLHLLQIVLSLMYEKHDFSLDFKLDDDLVENREFDGTYSKLTFAGVSVMDPVAEITDAAAFAAGQIQQFSRSLSPDRAAVFQQALLQLSPDEREGLQKCL
jgi:exportin-2 (importin alpha re-exporter)